MATSLRSLCRNTGWWRIGMVLILAFFSGHGFAQVDCLGIVGGSALPGTPCDDLNYYSTDDAWDSNCNCTGTPVDCNWDEAGGTEAPGDPCDDFNPLTANDVMHYPCNCSGYCSGCDCYGVPGGSALPGTPCDDLHPATVFDIFDNDCNCGGQHNYIYGQVFLDLDQDGLFEPTEPTILNRSVQISPGNFLGTSGLSGSFFIVSGLGTFDVSAASSSFDAQAGPLPPVTFATTGQASWGNNIPMWATMMENDLSVTIAATRTRPGFQNVVTISCKNEGTLPVGGTLTFTFDPVQYFVSSDPSATVVGNTVTWSTPILSIGEIVSLDVVLSTDAATPLFTPIQHVAMIQTTPPDPVPSNDQFVFNDVVVSSYDPNDKQVSRPELTLDEIASGTPLTYTVRFQNTGTYLAEDVRISDTLSATLNVSTFEFLGSSHPVKWSIVNGVLGVLFDQIMLPDSGSNEEGSHGQFMYRISPLPSLQPGDSISNSAAIYFDFNSPVITDAAVTVVDQNTGILHSRLNGLGIWPNPARDVLNISILAAQQAKLFISVLDPSGRVILQFTKTYNGGDMRLPLPELAPGLYSLRLEMDNRVLNRQFVKVE